MLISSHACERIMQTQYDTRDVDPKEYEWWTSVFKKFYERRMHYAPYCTMMSLINSDGYLNFARFYVICRYRSKICGTMDAQSNLMFIVVCLQLYYFL
jgi:hypothetical protein